jgi:hypothetical protein
MDSVEFTTSRISNSESHSIPPQPNVNNNSFQMNPIFTDFSSLKDTNYPLNPDPQGSKDNIEGKSKNYNIAHPYLYDLELKLTLGWCILHFFW